MPVTQKDVAERLNLSRSLVAGVLGNRAGVWASDETRKRIFDAAREMKYQPNAAAKSLRTGKSRNVLLAYVARTGATWPFEGAIERFAEALSSVGHQLVVSVRPSRQALLAYLREAAAAGSADAVIIWNDFFGLGEPEEEASLIESLSMPFIVKGRFETSHPEWTQIDFDHEGMMRTAVEHLAALGHSRIAFLGNLKGMHWTRCLHSGFVDAMEQFVGAVHDPSLEAWLEGEGTIASAREQMSRWLERPEAKRPTAVVIAANNYAWWGIEYALMDKGRRIGFASDDLAAAGLGWGSDFLVAGQAVAFERLYLSDLAEVTAQELLCPILEQKPLPRHMVRVLPALRPVGKMSAEIYHREMARTSTV
jgi:DNA-binding LacI/PurR family transcriptional regulator